MDDEGARRGPLDAEMAHQTRVVFDGGLQAVRSAQRFLGHEVELVESVVEAGLGRVVEQNQLVCDPLALEDLASGLRITASSPKRPTTLSL